MLVDSGHAQKAKALLADTITENETTRKPSCATKPAAPRRSATETSPARLALWVGAAFLGAVILVWILYQLS